MTHYVAPLRDLRFVIQEVLQAPALLQQMPRYASVDADLLDSLAEQAGRFAEEQVSPLNATADSVGCRWASGVVTTPPGFPAAYRMYRELGWPAVCADEADGGQQLPRLAFSLINEMQSAASHAFVMYSAVNHCAAACLRASGDAALKRRWLPMLSSGEVLTSMCMTEPQAGSDIGLLRTAAVRQDDGSYRISGSKIFASGAEQDLTLNILHFVLARVRGAPPGSPGLSLFVVPKLLGETQLNGVSCDGIEHKMGLHGSATCSMRFEEAQGWLVGQENFGLQAMFPMMNEARLLSGLQAVGIAEAACQKALSYAHERRQGRRKGQGDTALIVEHPDVQCMLLTQKAWTEGGRALVHWTALLIDQAQWHPEEAQRKKSLQLVELLTPLVKGFVTENAQTSVALALQVHGGHGYVSEMGVEQLVRDIRITTIYEGTTGIQAQDLLFRKVLADGGERLQRLQEEIAEWLAGTVSVPSMEGFRDALRTASAAAEEAVNLIRLRESSEPGTSLSVAVPFLRLLGHLVFVFLWSKMAYVATTNGQRGGWREHKRLTAQFYIDRLFPETLQLSAVIRAQPGDWRDAFDLEE